MGGYRNQLVILETKNKERRSVPLAPPVRAALKAHAKVRTLHSSLVFRGLVDDQPIDIRGAWGRALFSANVANFRFHDLRHSAASYMAMSGASLAVVAEMLGHKTLAMVKRYAHHSDSHISAEVSRMNQRIFGSLKGAPSKPFIAS